MPMLRVLAAVSLLALAACGKKEAAEDESCRSPPLAATATPGTYAAEEEAARLCVKKAAFDLANAGAPVTTIGDRAMARCAETEKAIGKSGGALYDWQRAQ